MEEEFKSFLLKRNVSEAEYNGGTLADKAKLVEAFEKNKGPTGGGFVVPRGAVFILLGRIGTTGKMTFVGSAVAVKCPNHDLVLTAGHCVLDNPSLTFYCIKQARREHGVVVLGAGTAIPLSVVCTKDSPDIAVLRRNNGSFEDTVPLCPHASLPWVVEPVNYYAKVGLLHCPSSVFEEDVTDEVLTCQFDEVSIQVISDHHVRVNLSLWGGSSGGSAVIFDGSLIGILTNSYGLNRQLLEQHNERAHQEESLPPLCEEESEGVEVQTVVSNSNNVGNRTLAIRLDIVYMREVASGRLITLADWIAHGSTTKVHIEEK